MDDEQILEAGEHEGSVDRVGQGRIPDDESAQAAGVLPHGGREVGQGFGVETEGLPVVLQVEEVRVAHVGAVLGVPNLLGQEHLVGGARADVVVDAAVKVEARPRAVGQALERRGDEALCVGQAGDVQKPNGVHCAGIRPSPQPSA